MYLKPMQVKTRDETVTRSCGHTERLSIRVRYQRGAINMVHRREVLDDLARRLCGVCEQKP